MLIVTIGGMDYYPTKEEWRRFHNFRPSRLQKIAHIFFPMMFMLKWTIYKNLKEEDCL